MATSKREISAKGCGREDGKLWVVHALKIHMVTANIASAGFYTDGMEMGRLIRDPFVF